MCDFLSAIVTRPIGDEDFKVLRLDHTDKHEFIIEAFNLRDTAATQETANFVRVEFRPYGADSVFNMETYRLRLDERRVPEWWRDIEGKVEERLRSIVSRMFITEQKSLAVGGDLIIGPGGRVKHTLRSRILGVHPEADMTSVNLIGVDMSEAELRDSNFHRSTIEEATMRCARMQGANLSYASLTGVNLNGAKLSGANLSFANVKESRLDFADLSEANLANASLCGANLIGANLTGANLENAYLYKASLETADLRGANLAFALIARAHFCDTLFDENTVWPYGIVPAGAKFVGNES